MRGDKASVARPQAAGISTEFEDQALLVAAIPEDEFERLVESDQPATVGELAEIGARYPRESETLTKAEEHEFSSAVETVRRYRNQGWWHVGAALRRIRDKRLFRAEFATFEACVKAEFRMSRSSAYRYLDAVQVLEELEQAGGQAGLCRHDSGAKDVPNLGTREGTIRPLVNLPADVRQKVIAALVERLGMGERLTARLVTTELMLLAPQYAGRRRAKTLDPAQRKLADHHLEDLAHEVVDVIINKTTDTAIVLKRAAVLAAKVRR